MLTLRCRYLSHPRERSESIGYWLTVFIKLPPLSLSSCETCEKSACSCSSREVAGCRDTHGTSRVTVHFEIKLVALSHAVVDEWYQHRWFALDGKWHRLLSPSAIEIVSTNPRFCDRFQTWMQRTSLSSSVWAPPPTVLSAW